MLVEILDKVAVDEREERYGDKKKTTFWCSESEKMDFDIYHQFKGTTVTNPITGEKLIMLQMRKLTEQAIVDFVRKEGILIEEYANDKRCFFEWGEHKVPISGYPDLAITGTAFGKALVEIKTYYGDRNQAEVSAGRVKMSYMVQLAIYMYYFKFKHGILFMINQGTGQKYEYDLYQDENDEYMFHCPDNEITFDLRTTFKKWENVWVNYVQKDIEPPIEYQYKYDIETLDWETIPASKISKARTNKAVIGDWQVLYSDFKDLIVERQGTHLGYNNQEIERIKELTKGYSKRAKKGEVRFDPSVLT